MRSAHYLFNFLVPVFVLAGCGGRPVLKPSRSELDHPHPTVVKRAPKLRVSSRPANTSGGVFIVEYHKVAKEEARWDRSIKKFRDDLERLCKMGFRPVLLSEYLANKMDLAPGASPVVFTFDDSNPTQFCLRPDGSLDPDCALGIWQAFAKEHADFPIRATFFILPNTGPWGQPKLADKKFELLKKWGCEVGSHTISHLNLGKSDPATAQSDLAEASSYINAKGFDPFAIALPYGVSPKNPELLKGFHRAALLVGAGPAPAPNSSALNPMRLPRIQGIDGDYGITFWLDKVAAGKYPVFVAP